MAARAIWKGRVRFGTVDVPVKLYSAVVERAISFRLLDAKRHEPVRQKMVDPESGDAVSNEEIRRAYEGETGQLVVVDPEELEKVRPKASRDIDVESFVEAGSIPHPWYGRPYYLGPDGDEDNYFALVRALDSQSKEGIARWVMRGKEYVGSLRVEGDYLVLITLRHAEEVIPASALGAPAGRDLTKREVDLARQIITAMEGELDIAAFRDEYRERVLELVRAKAAGKVVRLRRVHDKGGEESLEQMLKQSVVALKKRRKSA